MFYRTRITRPGRKMKGNGAFVDRHRNIRRCADIGDLAKYLCAGDTYG